MKLLRVTMEDGHAVPLSAVCHDEEHAMRVFQAWVAGLDVKARPARFKVEIEPL